jgi:hypothetical protein
MSGLPSGVVVNGELMLKNPHLQRSPRTTIHPTNSLMTRRATRTDP